jgi:transcriptional regulator with XRE-family HTH domain
VQCSNSDYAITVDHRGRPGRFLRYARRKAGLTQVELGERAGVPQSVVARIEAGRSMPRFDTLDRLLNACGYALDVSPRIGTGIDRTLMEPMLAATPEERGEVAADAATAADELRRVATPVR